MPNQKTVYISDDGSRVGLFRYEADVAGDLSSGELFVAKWNQTSPWTNDQERIYPLDGGAADITWISLGSFRFMPSLKTIIAQRFPDSKLIYGEFIPGLDNKMRYFKPLRIALYQRIVSAIHEYAPRVTIYFCMEDDEVWQKALGFTPDEKGGLSQMLDDAATTTCHLERAVR
jgi:hypothetical protein